jgi:predicted RNA binding protein YcfA (HicA-like mRNA interferase family)
MGRLAGFTYRDITRRLKALGLEFHRQAAGSHEIWRQRVDGRYA